MKNSPGYRRMIRRSGADAYEAMLQDTIKRQQEAIDGVARDRPKEEPLNPKRRATRRDGEYPTTKKG